MIKILKSSATSLNALVSDSGNKAACESEITAAATEHLGAGVGFLYSKGVPFSILTHEQEAILLAAGIQVIGESEAALIQAAFVK